MGMGQPGMNNYQNAQRNSGFPSGNYGCDYRLAAMHDDVRWSIFVVQVLLNETL
jgi:hypothetical protein